MAIRDGNYEIESLADKKRKIVHFNNLKPFKIDYEIEKDIRNGSESSSDESDIDEPICELQDVLPVDKERNIELEIERPCYLRRNRRPPERYGIPVMDF